MPLAVHGEVASARRRLAIEMAEKSIARAEAANDERLARTLAVLKKQGEVLATGPAGSGASPNVSTC